jgi:tripartite-type tricarboxylate transporter receptor subunit TctC
MHPAVVPARRERLRCVLIRPALNIPINKVLNTPEVGEHMRTQGMIAAPGPSEQFAALHKSDGARYSRIAREANVRLD